MAQDDSETGWLFEAKGYAVGSFPISPLFVSRVPEFHGRVEWRAIPSLFSAMGWNLDKLIWN